jgi:SAM-dependent methyltransferase
MDPNDVALGVTPDNWWFIGKRRLISLLLRRYCPKNAEILDVGAGMGEDLHVILPFGKVTVLDSSKNAVASVKKQFPKVSAYCNLIENVKFNKKFDAILAFDVLEHIKKDFSAVNNILNLLKPGGVLIGSVPAWPNLWSSHDRHLDHFRRYTPKSLRRLLKQFDIMLMSFWNFTLYPAVACLRLVQRVLPVKPSPGRLPKIVNSFLAKVLMFESMLSSKGLSPPYGVTLVFVARRR